MADETPSAASETPSTPSTTSSAAATGGPPGDHRAAGNYVILFIFFAGIVGLIMLMMNAGPGGGGTGNADIITIARANKVTRLDPANIDDIESGQCCDQIYEGLVKFADGENSLAKDPVPCLATSWTISDDGLEYTFKLREGVLFHRAPPTELDAMAVKMSLERLVGIDDTYAGPDPKFPYRSEYENIKAVDVIDPLTVKISLKKPDAVTLRKLAMGSAQIVSKSTLEELKDTGKFVPAGTGPFMLHWDTDWRRGESLTLERFERYWGGAAKPSKLVFKVVPDNLQRLNMLEAGQVHLISSLPAEKIAGLRSNPKVTLYEVQVPNVCYLVMNPNKHYFPDPEMPAMKQANPLHEDWVRRAITLAIDKNTIVQQNYNGLAVPAKSIVPPGLLGHPLNTPFDAERTQARLDEARSLTQARGYSKANPLKIKLWGITEARPYITNPQAVLKEVKRQLSEVWIDVDLQLLTWERYKAAMQTGAYYFCVIGWQTDNGDPDNFLAPLFALNEKGEAGPLNIAKWVNHEFDGLLRQARITTDNNARQEYYERAAQIMREAHVNIPMAHATIVWASSKDLEGFRVHQMGNIFLDQCTIKKDEPAKPADNSGSTPVNTGTTGNASDNSGN